MVNMCCSGAASGQRERCSDIRRKANQMLVVKRRDSLDPAGATLTLCLYTVHVSCFCSALKKPLEIFEQESATTIAYHTEQDHGN